MIMAITPRKKETDLETRTRILNSAAVLFAEQGYAASSIAMIARHAGVLPGSIYWAFQSKELILAEVMKRAGEEWDRQFLSDTVEGAPFTLRNVRGALARVEEGFRDTPEFLRLIMVVATERQAGSPEVLKVARDIRERGRNRLVQTLLAAYPHLDRTKFESVARRIARTAIQLLDGAFLALQIEPDQVTARELFDDAAQLITLAVANGIKTIKDDG